MYPSVPSNSTPHRRFVPIVLCISGGLAMLIGGALLSVPVEFQASSGITLPADPSLLSEMRAPGAVLGAAGGLMVAGSFRASLTFTALCLASLLYSAYAGARCLSLFIDGMPSPTLLLALAIELLLAVLSGVALASWTGVLGPRSPA